MSEEIGKKDAALIIRESGKIDVMIPDGESAELSPLNAMLVVAVAQRLAEDNKWMEELLEQFTSVLEDFEKDGK